MIRLVQNIIRNDTQGLGHFGASRKRVKNGKAVKTKHAGVDLLCLPGMPIYAATDLRFERIARPYKTGSLTGGVWLDGFGRRVKIFYCTPFDTEREVIYAGEVIAHAQNCAGSNKLMMPHIHVQLYDTDRTLIDPSDELEIT